jgi:hypothetical protein
VRTGAGKSFHAVIVAGGDARAREAAAQAVLAAHFADDAQAARKLADGVFEDLVRIAPEEGKKDITVDQIAWLTGVMAQRPFASTGKAAIIEDAGRMNQAAQNKLLKLLEEPAEGDVILLLEENPERLLQTVRSRCVVRRAAASRPYNDAIDTDSGIVGAAALGRPPDADDPALREDVKELARILAFGKDTLPDAWAILAKYEGGAEDARRMVRALEGFLRDIAVGAEYQGKIPEKQLRICRRAVPLTEEALRRTERGGKIKYALRDMALGIRTEASHA